MFLCVKNISGSVENVQESAAFFPWTYIWYISIQTHILVPAELKAQFADVLLCGKRIN